MEKKQTAKGTNHRKTGGCFGKSEKVAGQWKRAKDHVNELLLLLNYHWKQQQHGLERRGQIHTNRYCLCVLNLYLYHSIYIPVYVYVCVCLLFFFLVQYPSCVRCVGGSGMLHDWTIACKTISHSLLKAGLWHAFLSALFSDTFIKRAQLCMCICMNVCLCVCVCGLQMQPPGIQWNMPSVTAILSPLLCLTQTTDCSHLTV